jgi:integrative and conjugative element protein (TIGR02256 family)
MKGVLVDRYVLETVRRTAEDAHFRHEVGGVLLGSILGEYIHIVQATPPQAEDRFSFTRFWRSSAGHQEIASRAWKASGETVTYLGEWHSHPERNPSPSMIDHADWSKQLHKQKRNLVFVIQGMESLYIAFGRRLGSLIPLQQSVEDEHAVLWCPAGGSEDKSMAT